MTWLRTTLNSPWNCPAVYVIYDNLGKIARQRGGKEAAAQWQGKCEAKLAELQRLRQAESPTG